MTSRASVLSRALEPLVATLWTLFVVVSVIVAVVWTTGRAEPFVEKAISATAPRSALLWLLAHLDFLWFVLAATNVYLALAAADGLATARRWTLLIFAAVLALAWVGARTGFLLGPIQYGTQLGGKLGPVPLGLLFLWLVIILSARETVMHFFPRLSHGGVAVGTGLLAFVTDLSLEPLAAKLRGFWLWRASSPELPPIFDPPLTASLAWGLLAGVLALMLREKVVVSGMRRDWKPIAIFAILHVVFLAAHTGRWVRG